LCPYRSAGIAGRNASKFTYALTDGSGELCKVDRRNHDEIPEKTLARSERETLAASSEPSRSAIEAPAGEVGANPQRLGLLAKLVLLCGAVLIVFGVYWYGVTFEVIHRIWIQILERPVGPLKFRFILQPAMAAVAALRDGRRDARTNRAPYVRTLLLEPAKRIGLANEGLNATAKIIIVGILMDVVYQFLVLKYFHPTEALIVALLLAYLPYVILRGLVTRIALVWQGRNHQSRGIGHGQG
jgi:hypothetical protein